MVIGGFLLGGYESRRSVAVTPAPQSLRRQRIQPASDAAALGVPTGGRRYVQQRVAPTHLEQPDLARESLGILPELVVVILFRQGHAALF